MAGTGGSRAGAGRPPGSVNVKTALAREYALKHSEEAMAELARLATDATSEQARIAAIGMLLDRAHGKPKQSVEHMGEGGGPIQVTIAGDDASLL